MVADGQFSDVASFVAELKRLRDLHSNKKEAARPEKVARSPLSAEERAEILEKTDGACHLCGGRIESTDWHADHVLHASKGGGHDVENFLPAHRLCNVYRWDHAGDSFQWILKLGVRLRTQVEKGTEIGNEAAKLFLAHERSRAKRRRR